MFNGMQEEVLGSDDEEQEDPKDYRKGGYHPVAIGDVFSGRSVVLVIGIFLSLER